jgi:hypothetical protein
VFLGGTPDLKHLILTAHVPLRPAANAEALYEWTAGKAARERLRLVSVLPEGEGGSVVKGELGTEEGASARGQFRLMAHGSCGIAASAACI